MGEDLPGRGHRFPSGRLFLNSLATYLRRPTEYHKRIRRSNFIERTFGETRRRVKAIGRFPGETSCVSLAWAVLAGPPPAGAA